MTPSSFEERSERLKQLRHDLRTHLGVLSSGLQVLNALRDDADEFAKMQQMMTEAGLAPLTAGIDEMVELALAEKE